MEGAQRFHNRVVTGVLATVTDPQGRVLFVKQRKGPFGGHWLLPGGGLEPGESAEEAVAREMLEETGLAVREVQFVAVYEMRGEWAGGPYHLVLLGFKAEAEGEIPPGFNGDNVDGVRWAHPAELPLHSTDLRILTDAGAAAFGRHEWEAALARDGIAMMVYGA